MCDIGAGRLESRRCSFVHASLDWISPTSCDSIVGW
jgi:hypothetical protein